MVDGPLTARAIQGPNVAVMTGDDRLLVRACEDANELVALRATLRSRAAGRGRWTLWTWLLLLSGATVSADGENATASLLLLPLLLIILLLVVTYVSRVRDRANKADDWLSEIDFRLAQLATNG